MGKKKLFTPAEEEQIIDFVKSHEMLYNVRMPKFRHTDAKNRLWQRLARTMGKDANLIKKQWSTMRDYFVRGQHKNTTSSAASTLRRNESMMFLLGASTGCKNNQSSNQNQIKTDEEDVFQLLSRDKSTPVEPPPHVKPDGIALFFDSVAETVRSFSPVTIVEIKMQISNIVNTKELENARKTSQKDEEIYMKYDID